MERSRSYSRVGALGTQYTRSACVNPFKRRRKMAMLASWFGMVVLFLVVLLLLKAIRIFREYERGVVFNLGRFWQVKGPGLVLLVPGIQQVVRVDLRTVVLEVPTQDVISRDYVSVKVSAVVYFC